MNKQRNSNRGSRSCPAGALACRPRSEPMEIENPLNVALDAVEQLVANIIAGGGEAPLRRRLARLLDSGSAP